MNQSQKLIDKLLSTNINNEIDISDINNIQTRKNKEQNAVIALDLLSDIETTSKLVLPQTEDLAWAMPIEIQCRSSDQEPMVCFAPQTSLCIEHSEIKSNISIENYNLELTEIKTNKSCSSCSRNGIYTDSINNYCWIHCQ